MTTSRRDVAETGRLDVEELRRGSEHLRLALQAARMGTWDWDLEQNRVVWSEETHEIFGTAPENFAGTYEAYLDLVAPEAREDTDRIVRSFLEEPSELGVIQFDHPIVTSDGQRKWVEARGRLFTNEEGRFTRLIGVVADITESKRSEELLRESEKMLNATGRMGKIGGWEHDLTTGKAVWTRALYDIIEIPPDREPPGTDEHLSYYPPDSREILERAYNETVLNGTPFDLELQIHTAKGNLIWCRVQGEPLHRDGECVAMSGIFQDITERKRSEEQARETMARLQLAMESAEEGLWEWDMKTDLATFNDVALRMLGYEPDMQPMPGEWWFTQMHPDDRPFVEEAYNAFISGASPKYSIEFRLRRKDGDYAWVASTAGITRRDKEGRPLLVVGIHREITERKRTEEQAREATARLHLAMESADEGLWEWDFETDRVTFDEVALGMLGYDSDFPPQPGEWCIGQIHPDERPEVERAYEAYVSGTSPKYNVEFRIRRKDGEYTWIASTAKTVRADSERRPLLIVGIHRDITQRKLAERELAEYRQHLEKLVEARTAELKTANKELEAFAYSVSHDLRAPLRAIEGFSRILLEDYVAQLDEEGQRLGTIIQENTGRMGQLIDDLLAFSRLGRTAMHPSEIDMKNMAIAIFHEAVTPEDLERVSFNVSDLPRSVGDTNLMRQVWMNLFSNALKFSKLREPALIWVTSEEREDEVIYSVRDNGTGFDPKYKEKVFGVFQRLHSQREFPGTGVGLALVQRIIHRHGGQVWADGEIDKGATLSFSLPTRKEDRIWNTKNAKS